MSGYCAQMFSCGCLMNLQAFIIWPWEQILAIKGKAHCSHRSKMTSNCSRGSRGIIFPKLHSIIWRPRGYQCSCWIKGNSIHSRFVSNKLHYSLRLQVPDHNSPIQAWWNSLLVVICKINSSDNVLMSFQALFEGWISSNRWTHLEI